MKKLIIIILLFVFWAPTLVFAQSHKYLVRPGVLPDSKWYWADLLAEEVRYLLTFGKIKKANYKMQVAEERLSELKALYEKGVLSYTEKLLTKYEKEIQKAEHLYALAKIRTVETVQELQGVTEENLILHEQTFKDSILAIPGQADSQANQTLDDTIGIMNKILEHLKDKNAQIQEKKQELGVVK